MSRPSVLPADWNKPHRCPKCWAIALPDGEDFSRWRVYECCVCHLLFARHPWLARFVKPRPITCTEDHGGNA